MPVTPVDPYIDITGTLFQVPATVTDALYQHIQAPEVTDFTTGSVTGNGAFDKIMAGVAAQLEAQYDNGRITGTEYTTAYIALTQAALSTALQFILQSDNSFWQNQQAQIAAIAARIQVETARYAYLAAQENLTQMLPAQLTLVKEQAEVQHAQTSNTRLDGVTPVTGVVGEQTMLYAQQIISYKRDAEVKAAKLFTDAWITQKTLDDGLLPPLGFTNNSINEALTVVMANNAFGAPVP